jgi:hypothetical protein
VLRNTVKHVNGAVKRSLTSGQAPKQDGLTAFQVSQSKIDFIELGEQSRERTPSAIRTAVWTAISPEMRRGTLPATPSVISNVLHEALRTPNPTFRGSRAHYR